MNVTVLAEQTDRDHQQLVGMVNSRRVVGHTELCPNAAR
jgi:hypothetical protein